MESTQSFFSAKEANSQEFKDYSFRQMFFLKFPSMKKVLFLFFKKKSHSGTSLVV